MASGVFEESINKTDYDNDKNHNPCGEMIDAGCKDNGSCAMDNGNFWHLGKVKFVENNNLGDLEITNGI